MLYCSEAMLNEPVVLAGCTLRNKALDPFSKCLGCLQIWEGKCVHNSHYLPTLACGNILNLFNRDSVPTAPPHKGSKQFLILDSFIFLLQVFSKKYLTESLEFWPTGIYKPIFLFYYLDVLLSILLSKLLALKCQILIPKP